MPQTKKRIAINGFGRIGRAVFKIALERFQDQIEIVAINDLTDNKTLAHLLKYDTIYGIYDHEVTFDNKGIKVGDKHFQVLNEKEPENLPWKNLEIDVVIESTGKFTNMEGAQKHLTAGAKKVALSAPGKTENIKTYVFAVNDQELKNSQNIVSNASCTTNCIAPVMQIINSVFGVEKALMTTIHSYTADQNLVDGPHRDLRRARSAGNNIVPTSTGAATATAQVIPELMGLFDGLSIRVPLPVVSLSDITMVVKKYVTVEDVNKAIVETIKNPMYHGIVAATNEQLVSSDFIGNSHSAIVDLPLTQVVGGNLIKVIAWYDNEWGYSNRLIELAAAF